MDSAESTHAALLTEQAAQAEGAGGDAAGGPGADAGGDPDAVDAEFEEVKDDEKKAG